MSTHIWTYFATLRLGFTSWQAIHGKILQNEHLCECKFLARSSFWIFFPNMISNFPINTLHGKFKKFYSYTIHAPFAIYFFFPHLSFNTMNIIPIDFALKFQCVVSKFILEKFSTYQNLGFHLIIQNFN